MDVLRHPRQWAWVMNLPCLTYAVLICFSLNGGHGYECLSLMYIN
jgi:hypothetical protein